MSIAEPRTSGLVEGRRMTRSEFHSLYTESPPGLRAELIGGVVRMPSPVGPDHSLMTHRINGWLFPYEIATEGIVGHDNASTALDDLSEVQPDILLRIRPEFGGQTRTDRTCILGPPDLVIEVARSSRDVDPGPKHAEYERAGVREYLIVALEPDEIFWHVRQGTSLVRIGPDADGLYRSRVFPGLWLAPEALFAGNLRALVATVECGLASPEYAAFAERLAALDPKRREASS